MRLTREEYARLRLQRPDMFGAVDSVVPKVHRQPARALVQNSQAQPVGQGSMVRRGCVRVCLVAAVPRRLDSDNLATAMKALQDAIASFLGIDDGDEDRIRWEYGQIETRGTPGVIVKLEMETT